VFIALSVVVASDVNTVVPEDTTLNTAQQRIWETFKAEDDKIRATSPDAGTSADAVNDVAVDAITVPAAAAAADRADAAAADAAFAAADKPAAAPAPAVAPEHEKPTATRAGDGLSAAQERAFAQMEGTAPPKQDELVSAPAGAGLPSKLAKARAKAAGRRKNLQPVDTQGQPLYEEGAAHDQEEEAKVTAHLATNPDDFMPPKPIPKMPETPEVTAHKKAMKQAKRAIDKMEAVANGEVSATLKAEGVAKKKAKKVNKNTKKRDKKMDEPCKK
jgi:hypothetical protein